MGRKSVAKPRAEKNKKTKKWAEELLPKLQNVSLAKITIDDMAHLIHKSKSTLYQYFSSKEELVLYTVQMRVEQLEGSIPIFSKAPIDPTSEYKMFMDTMCNGIKDLNTTFLNDLKQYFNAAWEVVEQFLNQLLLTLRGYYEAGIEKKIFRRVNMELLIALDQFFVFDFITNLDKRTNSPSTLEKIVQDYLQLRFEGLLIN